MNNKSLIIFLISQDFKYFKLTRGLEKLGLEMYNGLYPENTDMVASLMGIAPADISNEWSDIYMQYLDGFIEQGDLKDKTVLKQMAEDCYEKLVGLGTGL